MFQKKGFIDHNLIKIKDKLSSTSSVPDKLTTEFNQIDSKSEDAQVELNLPQNVYSKKNKSADVMHADSNEKIFKMKKETTDALKARREEFRILKRDICEKLSEKLSYFPEDIKITERKLEELKNAIEKFASLLDEIKSIDENSWDENTLHSVIGQACRKVEHARLEYIRINARLMALQRESEAAEISSNNSNLITELSSLSLKQGVKIGFYIMLPLIVAIFAAAIVLALGYVIALKL